MQDEAPRDPITPPECLNDCRARCRCCAHRILRADIEDGRVRQPESCAHGRPRILGGDQQRVTAGQIPEAPLMPGSGFRTKVFEGGRVRHGGREGCSRMRRRRCRDRIIRPAAKGIRDVHEIGGKRCRETRVQDLGRLAPDCVERIVAARRSEPVDDVDALRPDPLARPAQGRQQRVGHGIREQDVPRDLRTLQQSIGKIACAGSTATISGCRLKDLEVEKHPEHDWSSRSPGSSNRGRWIAPKRGRSISAAARGTVQPRAVLPEPAGGRYAQALFRVLRQGHSFGRWGVPSTGPLRNSRGVCCPSASGRCGPAILAGPSGQCSLNERPSASKKGETM